MRMLTGKVVSNKMKNTIVVERTLTRVHPLYKKIMRRRQRLKAHTVDQFAIGDVVAIESTRPRSKGVYYNVVKKIEEKA